MHDYHHINRHLDELKKCASADIATHAVAFFESAILLERSKLLDLAESHYKWTEQHAKHKQLRFAYSKLILAFSRFYNEQYELAMPMLTELTDLFNGQNDRNGAAVCTLLQGSIYRTLGNFDMALMALWEAHEQLKKTELFRHFYMACGVTLGGTLLEMKQYEAAISHFTTSLEKAEATGSFYWNIYALHGLGKVYLINQNYPAAKLCFEKAKTVAEKYNHPLSLCNSIGELGNYYYAVQDFETAGKLHLEALTMREQYGFTGGVITSCLQLGETYIKQQRWKDSVDILEKGLKMALPLKVKLKMYQMHLLLSDIYERRGDLTKSLQHYKDFHHLREQVEAEDNARKLINARIIFEAEQTKKENSIIKKQKQEIEKKNIELQEIVDELTRAKIGRKARAITLVIAIALFILDDTILHFALSVVPANNYFISLIVKMVIIFSLGPINKSIEHFLLKKVIHKENKAKVR